MGTIASLILSSHFLPSFQPVFSPSFCSGSARGLGDGSSDGSLRLSQFGQSCGEERTFFLFPSLPPSLTPPLALFLALVEVFGSKRAAFEGCV